MSNNNERIKSVSLWEMSKVETIEEFYQRKFDWIPDTIRNEIGHFNVFQHEPIEPGKTKALPYKRRDFYKVMLVIGNINMNYADQVISVKKQALFSPIRRFHTIAKTWKESKTGSIAFSISTFSIDLAI